MTSPAPACSSPLHMFFCTSNLAASYMLQCMYVCLSHQHNFMFGREVYDSFLNSFQAGKSLWNGTTLTVQDFEIILHTSSLVTTHTHTTQAGGTHPEVASPLSQLSNLPRHLLPYNQMHILASHPAVD